MHWLLSSIGKVISSELIHSGVNRLMGQRQLDAPNPPQRTELTNFPDPNDLGRPRAYANDQGSSSSWIQDLELTQGDEIASINRYIDSLKEGLRDSLNDAAYSDTENAWSLVFTSGKLFYARQYKDQAVEMRPLSETDHPIAQALLRAQHFKDECEKRPQDAPQRILAELGVKESVPQAQMIRL